MNINQLRAATRILLKASATVPPMVLDYLTVGSPVSTGGSRSGSALQEHGGLGPPPHSGPRSWDPREPPSDSLHKPPVPQGCCAG